MACNIRHGSDWVQAEVVEWLGPHTYIVKTRDQLLWERHVDLLRELSPAGEIEHHPEFAPKSDPLQWPVPFPEPVIENLAAPPNSGNPQPPDQGP